MKAILTKYLGPTNTKGSRIKAWTEGGHSITVPYPYSLSGEDVHRQAAIALIRKLKWNPATIVGGGTLNGYAFVITDMASVYNIGA